MAPYWVPFEDLGFLRCKIWISISKEEKLLTMGERMAFSSCDGFYQKGSFSIVMVFL
jgi:hypothetical protein